MILFLDDRTTGRRTCEWGNKFDGRGGDGGIRKFWNSGKIQVMVKSP